jgi:hypothetical protein
MGGYPTGGYRRGYTTTAIIPGAPFRPMPGSPFGNSGYGNGLPPKIRAIFIPQGGAPMMGGGAPMMGGAAW